MVRGAENPGRCFPKAAGMGNQVKLSGTNFQTTGREMNKIIGFTIGFLALAAALPLAAESWRGMVVRGADGRAVIFTDDGGIHNFTGINFPPQYLEQELLFTGRPMKGRNGAPPLIRLTRAVPAKPAEKSPPGKRIEPGYFARTDRTLPEDEIVSGATVRVECPELGISAASGGREPIRVEYNFPAGYSREKACPVIIHFGGGMGSSSEAARYRRVVGPDEFIIVGADYDHEANEKAGLLKIGTCRDFESKIALYALQMLANSAAVDPDGIILSGFSSGAYSITDNLKAGERAWRRFSGFCAISGGSRTGSPDLGGRPVLFLMGEQDTMRHKWLREAEEQLGRVSSNRVTVKMVPGVGHSWDSAMDEPFLAWLRSEVPGLNRKARFQKQLEAAPSERAREMVKKWAAAAGVELAATP